MTVFNPTRFYKGFAFVDGDFKLLRKTQSDIDEAVEALELEEAKNAICCCYNVDNVKRYNQFFRLIDKIVQLNANGLTPAHKARNYTLEAAFQLARHMHRMSEACTTIKKLEGFCGDLNRIADFALLHISEAAIVLKSSKSSAV